MSETTLDSPPDQVVRITTLRENLGFTYQHVAETQEPIIVQRYSRQDVVMISLWEWRWLKGIEDAIRAGKIVPAEGQTWADIAG